MFRQTNSNYFTPKDVVSLLDFQILVPKTLTRISVRRTPIFTEIFRGFIYTFQARSWIVRGPRSSVGIATDYGLDGQGIEFRWGRNFPPVQTDPGAHPASCTMGTASFPGVKCGRGVTLTTHPLLAPRSLKSTAIPLPPFWATTGPVTGLL